MAFGIRGVAQGAIGWIPDGNAVAPPKLAGDAPVLNVFEPMIVDFFPAVREKADEVVANSIAGFTRLGVFQEPLFREAWFDRHIGTLAESDIVLMGFFFDEKVEFAEFVHGLCSGFEPIKSGKFVSREFVESPIRIHDVDHGKLVAQSDFVIGFIVSGGDFENAGAEFEVHSLIANDREQGFDSSGEGAANVESDE